MAATSRSATDGRALTERSTEPLDVETVPAPERVGDDRLGAGKAATPASRAAVSTDTDTAVDVNVDDASTPVRRAAPSEDVDTPDPQFGLVSDVVTPQGGSSEVDHCEVLTDYLARTSARADQLEDSSASSTLSTEALAAEARADGAGSQIEALLPVIEVLGVETAEGAPDPLGPDTDYQLDQDILRHVLTAVGEEGDALIDAQIAREQAQLLDLRADVACDLSDELMDSFNDSALATGSGVTQPSDPNLDPYPAQVNAFSACADVAAAKYEETVSMRDAFQAYAGDLGGDIEVLTARLEVAEDDYGQNRQLHFERAETIVEAAAN